MESKSIIEKTKYEAKMLVQEWADTLIHSSIKSTNPRLNHGMVCPSCFHIHGRVIDFIYPSVFLYDETKNDKYLKLANNLFEWGENLYCSDHSYYNDAQQNWPYTTMFFAHTLFNVLTKYKARLPRDLFCKWEQRYQEISEWIFDHFDKSNQANTNYHAACCLALAMAGQYFDNPSYSDKADEFKQFMQQFISKDGFTFGEGKPKAYVTEKGCKSIDIGYGIEETLPCLFEYAMIRNDETFLKQIKEVAKTYSDFILPDGAIDDSFGTRCFKWTYWGSRTSDGFIKVYAWLAKEDARYFDICTTHIDLLKQCTHDGFLYGGVDYKEHGEPPCIHHMITQAKALVEFIESDCEISKTMQSVPRQGIHFYDSLYTYRVFQTSYNATITGFDYSHYPGGHASGGAMTLLWSKKYGPILASSNTDELAKEPLNIQLSQQKEQIQSNVIRLWYERNGKVYSNIYDLACECTQRENEIRTRFKFCTIDHQPDTDEKGEIVYTFEENGVRIRIELGNNRNVFLSLPIINHHKENYEVVNETVNFYREDKKIIVTANQALFKIEDGFNLSPGFEFRTITYRIEESSFEVSIRF